MVKNKNTKQMDLVVIMKIVIPFIIILIILGIWIIKNKNNQQIETSQADDNIDFELATTQLDLEKLKSYGLPIMIDFGADSCIPCKEMAPILKDLNEEYKGKVIIKFVDVWKYQELVDGFPLEIIPTQFFFDKNGNPFTPSNPESMQIQMYLLNETNEHIYTAHQGGMTKEQILEVFKEMGVE